MDFAHLLLFQSKKQILGHSDSWNHDLIEIFAAYLDFNEFLLLKVREYGLDKGPRVKRHIFFFWLLRHFKE